MKCKCGDAKCKGCGGKSSKPAPKGNPYAKGKPAMPVKKPMPKKK